MRKKIRIEQTETIELKFKDKEEYLVWRHKILEQYEQSKIEYRKEMEQLFGEVTEQKDKRLK